MGIYLLKVFTKSDIIHHFDTDKQYDNWIFNKVKSGTIKKVKSGLYVLLNRNGFCEANKFEIGSKVTTDSYISYHSALEYYGVSNQVFNTVTICSNIRFRNFEFDDVEFEYQKSPINYGISKNSYSYIRVTALERTIIDCINKIDLAGGIEEIINAFELINKVDETELLKVLSMYDSVFLYQKAGYILEHFQETMGLSEGFFETCQKHLTNQIKYFLNEQGREVKYNPKWRLMAPKNVKLYF